MICESYQQLTDLEKALFIGKLQHAAQSNEQYFKEACKIIERAEESGLFERVQIMPERTDENKGIDVFKELGEYFKP